MIKRIRALQEARLVRWPRGRAVHAGARHDLESLPLYQIALWPDGWELSADGGLVIRDTHETAEARRWYAMAERNGIGRGSETPSSQTQRMMRMHRIAVPRGIVELVGTRFRTERAASVAVRLIAADWVDDRRRMLSLNPAAAFAAQSRLWSGSRHAEVGDCDQVSALVLRMIGLCEAEGMIPRLGYRVEARSQDGYGIRRWSCRVKPDQGLTPARADAIAAVLALSLTPWNRRVCCDGKSWTLLSVRVEAARR